MADKNTNINIKVIIDAAESAKTVQQTRQALRDLKSAALQVEEGSDAFDSLVRAAGALQDKMGDLSNQTKFFADDFKNLSGLAAIGSGIAGGFNVLQGSMALVGAESEDLNAAMQRVQITMGIVQGLTEVSKMLNKEETAGIFLRTLATKGAAVAQLVYAAAVGTSTGALKAFRIALLATGIGAIIVALGLAAEAMGLFGDSTEATTKAIDKMNASMEAQEELTKKNIQQIDDMTQMDILRAKIAGETEAKIEEIRKSGENRRIKELIAASQMADANMDIVSKNTIATKKQIEKAREMSDAAWTDLQKAQTLRNINTLEADLKLVEDQRKIDKEAKADGLKRAQEYNAKIMAINNDLRDEMSKLRALEIGNIRDSNEKAFAEAEKKREDELNANVAAYKADLAEYEKTLTGKAKANARTLRTTIYAKSIAEIEEKYRRINENLQAESDKRRIESQREFTKQYLTTEEYKRYNDFIISENTRREENLKSTGIKVEEFYTKNKENAKESFIEELGYLSRLQKALVETKNVIGETGAIITKPKFRNTKEVSEFFSAEQQVTDNLDKASTAFTDGLNKIASSIDQTDLPKAVKDVFSLKEVFLTPEQSSEFNLKIANFYKDKFLIIQEAEKQITEDMLDEAAARQTQLENQMKTGISIPEPDLTQIKDSITELQKGFSIATNGIDKLTEDQLKRLNDSLSKRYVLLQQSAEKSYDEELYALFQNLNQKKITNEQYLKELEELKQKNADTLLGIDVAYGKADQEQLAAATSQRINKVKSEAEKEKQIRQQALDVMVQSANEAYDAISAKVQDTYQQMIDMSNAEYAVRQKNIDREIEDYQNQGKEISIEEQARIDKMAEFQAKKDALEQERAAKEKQLKSEAFEKKRQMDMAAILANTAVAITKQLAETPLFPLGFPLIAAIAAQGVIQTAIVASQQPAFAEGGLVSGPGGPKDDKISVRLSNGESVINARSTKMYAPLLSQINQAGGGRAIPRMAAGGIVTNVPSSGMDTSRLEEIMLAMANRPIETYVKEASVTRAQARTVREKKRTSF